MWWRVERTVKFMRGKRSTVQIETFKTKLNPELPPPTHLKCVESRSISDFSLKEMIWLLQRTVSPLYGRLHNARTVLRSSAQRSAAIGAHQPRRTSLTHTFIKCATAATKGEGCWFWSGPEWVRMLINAPQGCMGYLGICEHKMTL